MTPSRKPATMCERQVETAAERPILFSAPMVRALLDGRKTQTRRVVKDVPSREHYGRDIMDWDLSGIHQDEPDLVGTDRWALDVQTDVDDYHRRIISCPYGVPGDVLYVREAFSGPWGCRNLPPRDWPQTCPLWFWADGAPDDGDWTKPKPGIHMPRWASRISLRITGVRVERLNEISEADALAEGLSSAPGGWWSGFEGAASPSPVGAYALLWQHINGPGSWAANPWVWVAAFEVVRPSPVTIPAHTSTERERP